MPGSGTFNDKTFFITNIGKRFATRAAELGATVASGEHRESLLQDGGGQWLNQGVFVLPEPELRYQKV